MQGGKYFTHAYFRLRHEGFWREGCCSALDVLPLPFRLRVDGAHPVSRLNANWYQPLPSAQPLEALGNANCMARSDVQPFICRPQHVGFWREGCCNAVGELPVASRRLAEE